MRLGRHLTSVALLAAPALCSDSDSEWETIGATPHEQYSSSVGVLGCKIDTNRVAYWPAPISCSNICVELWYDDRSVNLLRIDQSEGAYDVSYDSWNYLYTGYSAREEPTTGGSVEMQYRNVSASACEDILKTDDGKLALSASNSMNFLASCLDEKDSWVGDNYALYNVLDPVCSMGFDERCDLDWPDANQADCPSTLGLQEELTSVPVYNVEYGTGELILASTGERVDSDGDDDEEGAGLAVSVPRALMFGVLTVSTILIYPLSFCA